MHIRLDEERLPDPIITEISPLREFYEARIIIWTIMSATVMLHTAGW
jgi:hypothetical protein